MDMEDPSIRGVWAKDTKSDARLDDVENIKDEEMSNAESDGTPDGFQFVLPFLDFSSLLNVERVNKRLRETVKDPLVWIDLRIEWPASKRLTNEILLKLAGRADGHLKSLFIWAARAITTEALSRICELNPRLERICVPGCMCLKIENFVSLVEAHSLRARAKGLPGIRQVRIAELCSISPEHLLRLRNALGVSGLPQKASLSRRYYGNDHDRTEVIDEGPVDVELCPHCKRVRLMYDCTNYEYGLEGACRAQDSLIEDGEDECNNGKNCRSCIHCIPRCEDCGTCVRIEPDEDSLCSDLLCTACWDYLPQCIECERPACSIHEGECFPDGLDELCVECKRGDDTYSTDSRELDWDYFNFED